MSKQEYSDDTEEDEFSEVLHSLTPHKARASRKLMTTREHLRMLISDGNTAQGQVALLKEEIDIVNRKIERNNEILKMKDQENTELMDLAIRLETSVNFLVDRSRAEAACCSGECVIA